MTRDEALDKVRKLLELSKSDNPNEAAAAAAMAQRIMEKHAIFSAEIEAGDEEDITVVGFGPELKQVAPWQNALGNVVAKAFGCSAVWSKSSAAARKRGFKFARMEIAGRETDVQAAVLARDYCHREIDRLTAKWAAGRGRSWGVNFRMGCVMAIHHAIEEERAALKRELEGQVSSSALVVYDERAAKAREAHGKVTKMSCGENRQDDAVARAIGFAAGGEIYNGLKPKLEA